MRLHMYLRAEGVFSSTFHQQHPQRNKEDIHIYLYRLLKMLWFVLISPSFREDIAVHELSSYLSLLLHK